MIGMKRKEKMTKIINVLLLTLLISCTTLNTEKKDEKPSINNVIEAIKNITLPKM